MANETFCDDRDRALGCFDLALEELEPSDPGELSGAVLGMSAEGGEDAVLGVYVGNHHEIGHMIHPALRTFLREGVARVLGRDEGDFDMADDLVEGFDPPVWKGAELRSTGSEQKTELSVYLDRHCFGVVRGPALRAFLLRALAHAAGGEEFTDSDHAVLQEMCA